MLVKQLNTIVIDAVSKVQTIFFRNDELKLLKTLVSSIPSDSELILDFGKKYISPYQDLINAKDINGLLEQKEFAHLEAKYSIHALYQEFTAEETEDLWNDLDTILSQIRLIECTGPKLNDMEDAAKSLINSDDMKSLAPEDINMTNILSLLFKNLASGKNPEFISKMKKVVTGLDRPTLENTMDKLNLTETMDSIIAMREAAQDEDDIESDIEAEDIEDENRKYLGIDEEDDEDDEDEEVEEEADVVVVAEKEEETESKGEEVKVVQEVDRPPSPSPVSTPNTGIPDISKLGNMDEIMFNQAAQRLMKEGKLDAAIKKVKRYSGPKGEKRRKRDARRGLNPPAPVPPMDFSKMIEGLGEGGVENIMKMFSGSPIVNNISKRMQ